ncbi:MAG: hypothetical protein P5702_19050 [Limnospira sp. PMC 1291.21]|uniref:Uncharacterized protein n=3 Tax=Limnospira TaxID=2596745 RepID=A0A9P1KEG9_9CYAN|nr:MULTISPECIES: hypothetical protein [Limnospira]EDZ93873.1 hypothetical protein AmaxDRAFT_3382 [Limnospira maxima CS-328]EKD11609.1 hypothetical protein SPLC1_S010060 [Arthrospira platensis C1]MDC0837183.1 hypothetical protein [Limnoraphis robusta]MDY7055421.1 hypothetical protein [Limnospira fusiformis LS22]QJB27215.1 hypothetical protein HFV01_17315 [Limnospira fusiformis SAG 85.79]
MEAVLIGVILLGLIWRTEPAPAKKPAPPKRFYVDKKILKRVTTNSKVPADWGDPDDD